MELAAQIGISIMDFWQITPFELNVTVKAYTARLELENEITVKNNAMQAYLISRWVWQKKVDINKYLHAGEEKKIATDEEMLERVKALNALLGGDIVHKRP